MLWVGRGLLRSCECEHHFVVEKKYTIEEHLVLGFFDKDDLHLRCLREFENTHGMT